MIALTLASVAAFVTFCVHTFVGTRFAVPPLVGAGAAVPRATIWLNYLCWHIVTGLLLLFSLCLAGVVTGHLPGVVALIAALAFAWIAVVSIVATTKGGIPFYRFPASYLGAGTAVLAVLGWLR